MYEDLINQLDNYIKTNANNEITGAGLNVILNAMLSTLGAGMRFFGIANLSTRPVVNQVPKFYIAFKPGVYTHFVDTQPSFTSGFAILYDATGSNSWAIAVKPFESNGSSGFLVNAQVRKNEYSEDARFYIREAEATNNSSTFSVYVNSSVVTERETLAAVFTTNERLTGLQTHRVVAGNGTVFYVSVDWDNLTLNDDTIFTYNDTAFPSTAYVDTSDDVDFEEMLQDYVRLDSLKTVATSGSYHDLSDKPFIPLEIEDLENVSIINPENYDALVYSELHESWDNMALNPVAFSGDYNSLTNKPTIPAIPATTGNEGKILKVNNSGSGYGWGNYIIPSGECDSSSTSTDKTVTIQGVTELVDGLMIRVKNNSIASDSGLTLNVNGLGAKPVYYNTGGATLRVTTQWGSNYSYVFIYSTMNLSSGRWDMLSYDTNTIPIVYCDTEGSERQKIGKATNMSLLDNSYYIVSLVNDNTYSGSSNLTLNINGTGTHAIRINGNSSISPNNILPSGMYIVWYDGNYFQFRTDGKIPIKGGAFGGSYNDLTDKPAIPTIDPDISEISTNPVQNKAIGEKLRKLWENFDIANRLGNEYEANNNYIAASGTYTGQWRTSTTYKHYIVPLSGMRRVVVEADSQNSSYPTFLKSYTAGETGTPDYATGYDGCIEIPAGTNKSFVVPSDAQYMYFNTGLNEAAKPLHVYLTGVGVTEHNGTSSQYVMGDGTLGSVGSITIYSGSSAPTSVIGNDGDIYIQEIV